MGHLRKLKRGLKYKKNCPKGTSSFAGKVVYRFFSDPTFADDLVAGDVWLSTLQECRKHEDPRQGDPGEATYYYDSSAMKGEGSDPAFQYKAKQAGISIAPDATNVSIGNIRSEMKVPDAFILCTTEKFQPEVMSVIIA